MDSAAKFIRSETLRIRREGRKASPTIKICAAKALALAEIAGRADWPPATEEDVRKLMILSQREIEMLNAITSGRPPRNAQSILAGIRLKLEYSMKKPQAEVASDKHPVHVTVQMLGGTSASVTAEQAPSAEAETDEETIQ